MPRIEIPDPFIPGSVFSVDPEAVIARCKDIWDRGGKDHAFCPHCQRLRDQVEAEVESLACLTNLGDNVDEVQAALEFSEVSRPWGAPLAGPTDTQPYEAVDPDDPPPPDVVGFEVVK